MTSTNTETPASEPTRDDLIRQSYSAAGKRLREKYLDEFHALQKEEAKARGIDWEPKPTSEQKARAEVQRLLRENPSIARDIFAEMGNTQPGAVIAEAGDGKVGGG